MMSCLPCAHTAARAYFTTSSTAVPAPFRRAAAAACSQTAAFSFTAWAWG